MSAFSDWNGPGSGSANIPGIGVLNSILQELNTIKSDKASTAITTALNDALTKLQSLVKQYHDDYGLGVSASLTSNAYMPTGQAQKAQLLAEKHADDAVADLRSGVIGAIPQGTVAATVAGVKAELEAADSAIYDVNESVTTPHSVVGKLSKKLDTKDAELTARLDALLTDIKTQFLTVKEIAYNAVGDSPTDSTLIKIKNDVDMLNVSMGKLKLSKYWDITQWQTINVQAVPDGLTNDNVVLLMGVLSGEWDSVAPNQQHPGAPIDEDMVYKSGRAHIKFVNTNPWDAMVDMTYTSSETSLDNAVHTDTQHEAGSILAHYSKVDPRGDIVFGLYHGTDHSGREHIYLGVVVEDTLFTKPYVQDGALNYLTGQVYYIAGENFIPFRAQIDLDTQDKNLGVMDWYANGAVRRICVARAPAESASGITTNDITAFNVRTDNVLDSKGSPVLETVDNDDGTKDLHVGDPANPKHLDFYSLGRPSVFHGGEDDAGEHEIAYLTDLAQSIYWQRDVTVIVNSKEELVGGSYKFPDGTTVNFDKGAMIRVGAKIDADTGQPVLGTDGKPVADLDADGNPVTVLPYKEGAPVANTVFIPGVYLTEPDAPTPAAHAFKDGDVALLHDSGTGDSSLPDGKIAATIAVGSVDKEYPVAQVVGLDITRIKAGSDDGGINGTILVGMPDPDNGDKQAYGKVTKVNTANSTIEITYLGLMNGSEPDKPLFKYTKPSYVEFTGGAWDVTNQKLIDIPGTFDGYIHDITYEWSGLHHMGNDEIRQPNTVWHYVESYATWTAHHENNDTMAYEDLKPWSYTDLIFEGYRVADAQDLIDNRILEYAGIQSDFAEDRETITYSIPERDTTQTVANPAYIHHKPWAGMALLDSGDFSSPLDYVGWLVDGGDYTGAAGDTVPTLVPSVPANQQFNNVIMRIYRGKYSEMPEIKFSLDPADTQNLVGAWANYQYTFRWALPDTIDPENPQAGTLYLSDGVILHKFMEMSDATTLTYLTDFNIEYDDTTNILTQKFSYLDMRDPTQVLKGDILFDFKSDADAVGNDTIKWLFEETPGLGSNYTVTFTSPRMDALDEEIADIKEALPEKVPVLDDNGDKIPVLDEDGNKIPVLDEDGNPVIDPDTGEPEYEWEMEYPKSVVDVTLDGVSKVDKDTYVAKLLSEDILESITNWMNNNPDSEIINNYMTEILEAVTNYFVNNPADPSDPNSNSSVVNEFIENVMNQFIEYITNNPSSTVTNEYIENVIENIANYITNNPGSTNQITNELIENIMNEFVEYITNNNTSTITQELVDSIVERVIDLLTNNNDPTDPDFNLSQEFIDSIVEKIINMLGDPTNTIMQEFMETILQEISNNLTDIVNNQFSKDLMEQIIKNITEMMGDQTNTIMQEFVNQIYEQLEARGTFVKLVSTTPQLIKSDIGIAKTFKLYAERENGTVGNTLMMQRTGTLEQLFVGNAADPLNLQHNAKASDGTVIGKNIKVTYVDPAGASKTDALAYLTDIGVASLGIYQITASLSTTLGNDTTVPVSSFPVVSNLNIGKTLACDPVGTLGLLIAQPDLNNVTLRTLLISGLVVDSVVLLGNVDNRATAASAGNTLLPLTVADAQTVFSKSMIGVGDYCRIINDETTENHTIETYIINIDSSDNITWGNDLILNTADYQDQSKVSDNGKVLTGSGTVGVFGPSLSIDSAPTDGSNNLVKSGGVYDAIQVVADDVKANYVDLTSNESIGGDKTFTGDTITVEKDLVVEGDTNIGGDTTIGGNLTVTGDTTLEGDLTVEGDITMPPGTSIDLGDQFTNNTDYLAVGDTDAISKGYADKRYVKKEGDTMAGKLLMKPGSDQTAQMRDIIISTTDLDAGVSALATGTVYLVYEA